MTPRGEGYIPVPMDAFDKAEADAKESGMTVSAWVTYLIRDYAPPASHCEHEYNPDDPAPYAACLLCGESR